VIYESRLELARLLFADFDARVGHIVAQPFVLRTSVDRKPRKHIPDYLLITRQGRMGSPWPGIRRGPVCAKRSIGSGMDAGTRGHQ
jgi:hypothetical protein